MAEGVNMGRKCPWTKENLMTLYNKVDSYCKIATLYALQHEGQSQAMETMATYNIFKYPVVYVFIHYHFGRFEDLNMNQQDITSYITMYMLNVKQFTKGMMEGMMEQTVFDFDKKNEIAPALIQICKEVLFIEDNY